MPWWVDLAKVHVLVEDELTQALLAATWEDVTVRVEAAGSGSVVRGMVNDAKARGAAGVFGVVDRDFAISAGWSSPQVYRLERHEAENYLLDFEVLATLAGVPRAALEDEATTFATACCPWMAARRVLWDINGGLVENFPTLQRPGQQTPFTLAVAVNEVRSATYWKGLNKKLRQDWTERALRDLVHQHHDTFTSEVTRGLWRTTFSGKEVLQHLRGRFPGLTKRGSTAMNDVDLAKLVARQWRTRHSAPAELMAVLGEVKRHVAM